MKAISKTKYNQTKISAQQVDSSDGLTPAADLRRWAAKFSEMEVCIAAGSVRADARTRIKLWKCGLNNGFRALIRNKIQHLNHHFEL